MLPAHVGERAIYSTKNVAMILTHLVTAVILNQSINKKEYFDSRDTVTGLNRDKHTLDQYSTALA